MTSPRTAPRTALSPISKGGSSPVYSEKQSFLTTFPPEIRNRIYELLFVFDGPVEVTPDASNEVLDAEAKAAIFRMLFLTPLDCPSRTIASRNKLIRFNLASAMPFMRTCRQIYHEAIGLCYSQNIFTFYSQHRDKLKLSAWIETISMQAHLLKKLTIGLKTLSTSSHPVFWYSSREIREFDILPVLRIIWFSVSPHAEICLHPDTPLKELSIAPQVNMAALHKVIRSITQHDCLGLYRYARIPGALTEVLVRDSVTQGSFRYGSIYGAGSRQETFKILDNGNHIQLDHDQRQIRLCDGGDVAYSYLRRRLEVRSDTRSLPPDAYSSVLNYVFGVPFEIQVDLLATARSYAQMARNPLLHVSAQLRLDGIRHFLSINRFNLTYASETARTHLRKVAAINTCPLLLPQCAHARRRGSTIADYHSAEMRDKFNIFSAKEVTFTFDFRPLYTKIELYDVRISILGFLRETTHAFKPFTIYCRAFSPQDMSKSAEVNAFSGCVMRMRVFIALSHMLWAKPWEKDRPCPDIYINGHGFAVEMKKVGSKRYSEIPGGMNLLAQQIDPFAEGERFARIIRNLAIRLENLPYDHTPVLTPKSTLLEVWAYLRDLYWLGTRVQFE